ncbi:MAG TPA: ankyrin repeat domain-containing protein [Leptospiraceae bacterium]|nr:ankyrin repeat domain-containing protein [Leptospiraceae bacterium]HMW06178.1 ankyrin repeat domain-containing protein [Leptospiraceae bacterium]HMX30694.1 ankyrin repeat domain-containing protein [Leptospiraceae bacterium]HMY31839.1 ankyrin repeat domain-containing protein [Leptospiraceae bacterium]HMZ64955.1 ankyrin repeat domain-containing protein [Leptospiraceae bacterium]
MNTKYFYQLGLILILILSACATIENNPYESRLADAVYEHNLYSVKYALATGAGINEKKSFYGNHTALMIACKEGNYEIAEWLLENGADPNMTTRDGHTALMLAAYNRYPDIVKLLLKHKANVNIVSKRGHTALSETTRTDSEKIKGFLKEAGAHE